MLRGALYVASCTVCDIFPSPCANKSHLISDAFPSAGSIDLRSPCEIRHRGVVRQTSATLSAI